MPASGRNSRDTIRLAEYRLRLAHPTRLQEAPPLRAVFGQRFSDEILAHLHKTDGSPIHEYPRIQFKIHDATATLLGINEGADLLQRMWPKVADQQLGGESLAVLDSQFENRIDTLQATKEPAQYRFATPWLALNQQNFRAYTSKRNQRKRKEDLARVLIGNCLGIAKSLGIRFTDRIDADCSRLHSIKTAVQGSGMVGFVGKFNLNVELPEGIGLGKSAARGFGTVAQS